MKKGCLVALLTWGVCAAGYWYFLHDRFAAPLDVWVPVIFGLLMGIVIGNLRAGLGSAIDAARVSEQSVFSGAIGEKPRDKQVVTVSGRIRATGAALRAPLTDRSAVLYSYDIGHPYQDRNGFREIKDYAGFALAPAVIDSKYGPIRLMGFPNLDGFPKEALDAEPALAKANEYIGSTTFTNMTGFNPVAIFREVKELMTDDDGQLRKDWRMRDEPELPDDAQYVEQIVTPGEQVTAIGRYSAEKDGLIADLSAPLQLVRGDAQVASGTLWRKAAGAIIGALIFAGIVNGALYGVLRLAHGRTIKIPKNAKQTQQDAAGMLNAARDGDVTQMDLLAGRGAPVDSRDDGLSTPLMRAADAKTAQWLIAHGATVNTVNNDGDTPLMVHAHAGNADVVKELIKAGAKLDAVSTKWKTTALQQALDAEKLDIVQILRDAGAHDVTVTEKTGQPVGKDSEPLRAALKYLDAIQRQDPEAMNAVSTRGPFKDVDFKLWKETRPVAPRLVSGFANDQAATIALRGRRMDGVYTTWSYQLVRADSSWKVSDERWETRLDSKEP